MLVTTARNVHFGITEYISLLDDQSREKNSAHKNVSLLAIINAQSQS